MPCPGTRALCWQHLVLPWEHCAACMKLSQDTPEQLKPPEIKTEAGKLSQLLVGTPPQHRAPGNGADLRGVRLSPHWLSIADRNAWTSFPGRLRTSTTASGGFAHSRFDRNEKGAHDESPTSA